MRASAGSRPERVRLAHVTCWHCQGARARLAGARVSDGCRVASGLLSCPRESPLQGVACIGIACPRLVAADVFVVILGSTVVVFTGRPPVTRETKPNQTKPARARLPRLFVGLFVVARLCWPPGGSSAGPSVRGRLCGDFCECHIEAMPLRTNLTVFTVGRG